MTDKVTFDEEVESLILESALAKVEEEDKKDEESEN